MKWVPATKLVIGLGGGACVVAIAGLWATRPKVEGPIVEAQVVRFETIPSRWQSDKVVVVASTPDGRIGHGVLTTLQLNELNCKVGDPVAARVVGSALVVDAGTCRKVRIADR